MNKPVVIVLCVPALFLVGWKAGNWLVCRGFDWLGEQIALTEAGELV